MLRMVVAAALAAVVTGCVSIPVSLGRPSSQKLPGTVTTLCRAEIDSIAPVVKRAGAGGFGISFEAIGSFERETVGIVEIRTSPSEHVAMGLFPGLAEDNAHDAVGNALTAFWYNICFAGTPTVYGLLLEPVFGGYSSPEDATATMGGKAGFPRAPLIGFYKFQRKGSSRTERVSSRDRLNQLPLETLSIQPVDPATRVLYTSPGNLTIAAPPDGKRECAVRLSISPADPLAKPLAPFLDASTSFTVLLPE